MDFTTKPAESQPSLGILPLVDAKQLGPASRTLAAFYDIADQDRQTTFKSLPRIAHVAGLSVSTVQRHIRRLIQTGHIEALGRQKSPGRRMARRTQTYRLTRPLSETTYLPLPKSHIHLPWSQAVVLAYLIRWTGPARVTPTARSIASATGLSLRSVKAALAALPNDRGERCRNDHRPGAEMTVAVNLRLQELNSKATVSQQEHTRPPKKTAVKQVVFSDSSPTPEATPPQGPDWRNIQPEDLHTPASRKALFFQAVKAGVITDTHENRLYFNACCIHSRGKDNPGGHLRAMITNRWTPPKSSPKKSAGPKHNLGHIERSDLTDPAAAVSLVNARIGPLSEHCKTLVSAEAIHCLRVAKNPAAMFASNVASERFFGTNEDEMEAHRRQRRALEREYPREYGLQTEY